MAPAEPVSHKQMVTGASGKLPRSPQFWNREARAGLELLAAPLFRRKSGTNDRGAGPARFLFWEPRTRLSLRPGSVRPLITVM